MVRNVRILLALCLMMRGVSAWGQEAEGGSALEALKREAAAARPIVESELARQFLATVGALPEQAPRFLWRDRATGKAYTEAQYIQLPEESRAPLVRQRFDSYYYYTTNYGSPTIYARPLDILAKEGGVASLAGKKALDFGFGMIGQLRMMASLGADVHGVDVEPLLSALYAEPGDVGRVKGVGARDGRVTVHIGQWPAESRLKRAVGGKFDIILSKNTLKAGYIHPARQTNPKWLVHLGVSDEEYVQTVHRALKPGGLFLIYNICPPQNPPDKPYIPWADGKCPFARELLEKAGFDVLAWNTVDDDKIHALFAALGYDNEQGKEALKGQIFTWYTLLRKR